MSARWLQVLLDSAAAARRTTEFIAGRLRSAVAAKGRFCMAVSDGLTATPMFEALAATSLPGRKVEIYQVNERIAPEGSPKRNLISLRATLGATGARIMPMPVESNDLASAAQPGDRYHPSYHLLLRQPDSALDLLGIPLGLCK